MNKFYRTHNVQVINLYRVQGIRLNDDARCPHIAFQMENGDEEDVQFSDVHKAAEAFEKLLEDIECDDLLYGKLKEFKEDKK